MSCHLCCWHSTKNNFSSILCRPHRRCRPCQYEVNQLHSRALISVIGIRRKTPAAASRAILIVAVVSVDVLFPHASPRLQAANPLRRLVFVLTFEVQLSRRIIEFYGERAHCLRRFDVLHETFCRCTWRITITKFNVVFSKTTCNVCLAHHWLS